MNASFPCRDEAVHHVLRVFTALAMMMLAFIMAGCATVVKEKGPRTVAVWDLEDLSFDSSARPDLGQVLSGEIIQVMSQTQDIRVVERQRLVSVLEELNLGSSGLADESSRLKVGRVLGAGEMVFGGYMVVGRVMRLDVRLVDVQTGRVVKTAKREVSSDDLALWLQASREAASELLGAR